MATTTMRSEDEMKLAHQELADFFYPREVRDWDDCDCKDVHAATCDKGERQFQGWSTSVHQDTEVGGPCDKKDCTSEATMRIRLNIWGSLYEFYVCQAHGRTSEGESRDGFWCDDF